MNAEERYAVVLSALKDACKYMRKYPPVEFPYGEYSGVINVLVGGAEDPEGEKYLDFFLRKAIKERMEESF